MDRETQGKENRDHVMKWINIFCEETETAIDSFICLLQNYNVIVADQNNTVMLDSSRSLFNTDYRISRPVAKIILESGLAMSISCAYYLSRQNLNFRIGDNAVWTQDVYESVAAFWSHWREVFSAIHGKDNTDPKIAEVMQNTSMDGREEEDLRNVQV